MLTSVKKQVSVSGTFNVFNSGHTVSGDVWFQDKSAALSLQIKMLEDWPLYGLYHTLYNTHYEALRI